MTTFLLFRRIFNLGRDILFAWLILKRVGNKNENKLVNLFCDCSLLSLFLMYSSENGGIFSESIIRTFYRIAIFTIFLKLSRKYDLKLSIYIGMILNSVILIAHNIFMTPYTRPFILGTYHIVSNSFLNLVLVFISVNFVCVLIYYIIYRVLPVEEIRKLTYDRIIISGTLTVITTYINRTIENFPINVNYNDVFLANEISIFSIILQFALLFCLIFLERNQYNNMMILDEKEKAMATQVLLDNIRHQQINDDKIREFRHDSKNHLQTISYLIDSNETKRAKEYIADLLDNYTKQRPQIRTNNLVLDGILTRKITEAEENGIKVTMNANFTHFTMMSDTDICIIFANALDNAIEAVSLIPDEEDRYIDILSDERAGNYYIVFRNNYYHDLKENPELKSTKKEKTLHGIGISNMKKTVEMYNGTLMTKYDDRVHKFTLTISIPLEKN